MTDTASEPGHRHRHRQSWLTRHTPALLAVAVMTALIFGPSLGAGLAVGHPLGDAADHLWGGWWFGGELLAGRWPGTTHLLAFPEGGSLWYPDALGALLALPLRPLGPTGAWVGLLAAQTLLVGLAAYAVGQRVSGSRMGGLAAAAVLGASPYLLGLLHSGLSELCGLSLPVLFVGALLRSQGLLGDQEGRRPALAAGALLAGCAVQSPYYAVAGGLLLLCCQPGPGFSKRLAPAAITAASGLLLAGPWLAWTWWGLHADDGLVQLATAPGWTTPGLPPVDLAGFLVPGSRHFPDLAAQGNPGVIHVHYLGWVAIALAGWAAWRHPAARRLLLPAGLYGLLCLGPELRVAGWLVGPGGAGLPLPLRLLYLEGSPLHWVHHPYRLVALLLPLLAILVALAIQRLPRWLGGLAVVAVLAEALLISPATWPLPTTPTTADHPEAISGDGAVLDWPPDASLWNRRYLLGQLNHGRPIAYGVNVFLPATLRGDPLVADLLHLLDDPFGRARNRDIPLAGPLHLPAQPGPTQLGKLGFSTLLLHHDASSAKELEHATMRIEHELGVPSQRGQGWTAWALR